MKKLLVLPLVLLLTACGEKAVPVPVPVTQFKVVQPSDDFFKCPNVDLPDPKTLTDKQISKLLFQYEKANSICRKNMESIYIFLKKAKKQIEGK